MDAQFCREPASLLDIAQSLPPAGDKALSGYFVRRCAHFHRGVHFRRLSHPHVMGRKVKADWSSLILTVPADSVMRGSHIAWYKFCLNTKTHPQRPQKGREDRFFVGKLTFRAMLALFTPHRGVTWEVHLGEINLLFNE
jgi:hypothetical protein